jgi:hypothetical protein
MKYWDLRLNAPGARTFIATVHIAATVIGWKHSGKEKTGQTQFSTKFATKLSIMPGWSPVYFFLATWNPRKGFFGWCTGGCLGHSSPFCFPVFWNLVPYVTKQGVPVPALPDFTGNVNALFLVTRLLLQQVHFSLYFLDHLHSNLIAVLSEKD